MTTNTNAVTVTVLEDVARARVACALATDSMAAAGVTPADVIRHAAGVIVAWRATAGTAAKMAASDPTPEQWAAWRIYAPRDGRGANTVARTVAVAGATKLPGTFAALDDLISAAEAVRVLPVAEGGGVDAMRTALASKNPMAAMASILPSKDDTPDASKSGRKVAATPATITNRLVKAIRALPEGERAAAIDAALTALAEL